METITKNFIKFYPSILQLDLTDKRKMILCSLIHNFERWETKEVLEYKGIKYHYYFNQKEMYTSLGMPQRTFETNLKWLQEKGYIQFKSANRPGYLFKTTYFYINMDFIQSLVAKNNNSKRVEAKEMLVEAATEQPSFNENEQDILRVTFAFISILKEHLLHSSMFDKQSMEDLKKILLESVSKDILKKGMQKCLDDGWFTLVDSGTYYSVKNTDMLNKITSQDVKEMNYNELYSKATEHIQSVH
ncbi:MAG: hypothetical protein LBS69_07405 [Prevotellaceae bacterium]|jgi:hypothetical protein|nr:hypothetical protein [Prevotellaceae bacterium]